MKDHRFSTYIHALLSLKDLFELLSSFSVVIPTIMSERLILNVRRTLWVESEVESQTTLLFEQRTGYAAPRDSEESE